ncbi:MAG: hypothetical protein PHY31_08060 [Smithellaceae bacterium]|nr:hypothetical protein [Smithellaceae bacterium]
MECYSGCKLNESPRAFVLDGRRREIAEIIDCWREGGLDPRRSAVDYFKVKTEDGEEFMLRYISLFNAWSIAY